jgi:ribonuclease HI
MPKNLILFADGGSRGNPGASACGFVVYEFNDKNFGELNNQNIHKFENNFRLIEKKGQFLGIKTNNQAEWQGLISGVEFILKTFKDDQIQLKIFLDSQLVVRQVLGQYKVKNPGLKELFEDFKILVKNFEKLEIEHIYREQNKLADKMVNQTLDQKS